MYPPLGDLSETLCIEVNFRYRSDCSELIFTTSTASIDDILFHAANIYCLHNVISYDHEYVIREWSIRRARSVMNSIFNDKLDLH